MILPVEVFVLLGIVAGTLLVKSFKTFCKIAKSSDLKKKYKAHDLSTSIVFTYICFSFGLFYTSVFICNQSFTLMFLLTFLCLHFNRFVYDAATNTQKDCLIDFN